jgi:plasmid stabilization system protein ParE
VSAGYALRPKADRDLDEILDNLAERASLEVAFRFLAAAHDTFALVATQPDMGWPCRLSHRDLAEARVFRIGKPFESTFSFTFPGVRRFRFCASCMARRTLKRGSTWSEWQGHPGPLRCTPNE